MIDSRVKLAVALNRAMSHKDVIRHPILTDLAELIDNAGRGELLDDMPERQGEAGFAPTCRHV